MTPLEGTRGMATSRNNLKPRYSVRGHGGHSVVSWRDLGREGPGNGFAGASPFVQNGVFIQGHRLQATRESGPGLPLERRFRVENPNMKRRHKFTTVNGLCLKCAMLREGHDRLMEKLRAKT